MKLIDRTAYMNKLASAAGTPDIKVVTGIRRCGKSKLLEAFADYLRERNPTANIIRVNFNLLEFEPLMQYRALYSYIEAHFVEGCDNVVMIDEVQMCEGFEKAVNSLHASEKYDIYVTGSNAFLLSGDLSTLFTGRTFEVEVFPFSLAEFAQYHGITSPDEALARYLREGGMPGSYLYPDERARYAYLSDVFDTLVLRDVKQKYRIRSAEQLKRACEFLMDNIGNVSSLKNMAAELSRAGLKISDKTLAAYIDHLCNAFAFYRVRRFDVSGKRYLASGDKYYLADHSFRYAQLGTRKLDFGHIYENMVAIELLRRGWEVYVGVLYQKEVDFVAIKQGRRIYIQVSDDISQESTFEREISPLRKIRDAYPKAIIARTGHETTDWDGIKVIDLARWLMGTKEGVGDF